tara:strand:- start:2269 stop:2433 length:165 start_codon:yes stop_codon:yes gene_type:complete
MRGIPLFPECGKGKFRLGLRVGVGGGVGRVGFGFLGAVGVAFGRHIDCVNKSEE